MTPGEVSDESYPHRRTRGPQRTPVARGTVAGPARPGHRPGHGRWRGPRGPQRCPGHDGLGLPAPVAGCPDGDPRGHDGPPRTGAHVGMHPAHQRRRRCPRPARCAGSGRWTGTGWPAATCQPRTRPKRGGNPGRRPPPKIPASAPPAAPAHPRPGLRGTHNPVDLPRAGHQLRGSPQSTKSAIRTLTLRRAITLRDGGWSRL